MNIIFISPNYPAGHKRYVAALRQAGHTVLGIGDAGDETFAPELRGSLNGYYRVGDLHDYDSVYRACCYYTWQFGRIDAVESLNPYWRDLVSALRSEVCTEAAAVDKEYAKLSDAGLKAESLTPRLRSSSPKKVCAFAAEHGYPLWAAPAGNKRLGSRLIVADAGVRSLLRGSTKDEYVFSVFPEGEELSVDGLMLNGQIVACGAHQRSADGQSVIAVEINELGARCLAAAKECGCEDGFFHIRAVRLTAAVPGLGKKGEACFTAFEPVPPHEYIIDLLNLEFECDLRRTWAEKKVFMLREEPCAGWSENTDGSADMLVPDVIEPVETDEPELPLARVCAGALACRSFERSYRNLHEKILRKLAVKLTFHGRTEEPDRWDYSDYVYLFGGENAAELKRSIKFITEDYPLPDKTESAESTAAAAAKTAEIKKN